MFIIIPVKNWISAIVYQPSFCWYREMWYLTNWKSSQWKKGNELQITAPLIMLIYSLKRHFCVFYWLSFSKVETPNLSGSVCMPDYIFNSWEDVAKCRLIKPPCLPRFGWLAQRGLLNSLMRIVLGRRSCESDLTLTTQSPTHGFSFGGMNIVKFSVWKQGVCVCVCVCVPSLKGGISNRLLISINIYK